MEKITSENFVDLALVEFDRSSKRYLFQMPPFTRDCVGQYALVNTVTGEKLAKIVSHASAVRVGGDKYNMIVTASGAKLPIKKVLGIYDYSPLVYPETEFNDDTEKA